MRSMLPALRLSPLLLPLLTWGCPSPDRDRPGKDEEPLDTDTAEEIHEDEAPVALISGPESAWVDEIVTLDASGSQDPQGYALSYAWACDDGATAEGITAEFSFAEAGLWTCTLRVRSTSGLDDEDAIAIEVSPQPTEWTLMVFLAGDNDLAESAIEDLNEMETATASDEVRVVVELDLPGRSARRYLVHPDEDTDEIGSPILQDLGSVDSGDPAEVVDFVRWAVERFPARRYGLIFWNHGESWSFTGESTGKGVSMDFSSGNDISVAEGELEEVLKAAYEAIGGPLDLLGMDACNMASWEIAQVSEPFARVFVASQDSEDFDGWAYDTSLTDLAADPFQDAAALADIFTLRFQETGDSTLSAVDLDALHVMDESLDRFAAALIASGQASSLLSYAGRRALDFDYSNHDLRDFVEILLERDVDAEIEASAAELLERFDLAILANRTNGSRMADAHGLSIYSPRNARMPASYADASWSSESLWDDFIRAAAGD